MISEGMIKKAVEKLAEAAKPKMILLFGSYARGDAREQSDLDFLIVEHELKSRRREMVRLHDVIRPMQLPVDILVVSESTFKEWSDVPGTVIYKAKKEGRVYYAAA